MASSGASAVKMPCGPLHSADLPVLPTFLYKSCLSDPEPITTHVKMSEKVEQGGDSGGDEGVDRVFAQVCQMRTALSQLPLRGVGCLHDESLHSLWTDNNNNNNKSSHQHRRQLYLHLILLLKPILVLSDEEEKEKEKTSVVGDTSRRCEREATQRVLRWVREAHEQLREALLRQGQGVEDAHGGVTSTTTSSSSLGVLEVLSKTMISLRTKEKREQEQGGGRGGNALGGEEAFSFASWQRYGSLAALLDAEAAPTRNYWIALLLVVSRGVSAGREEEEEDSDEGEKRPCGSTLSDIELLRLFFVLLKATRWRCAASSVSTTTTTTSNSNNKKDAATAALIALLRLMLRYVDPELCVHLETQRCDVIPCVWDWVHQWMLGMGEGVDPTRMHALLPVAGLTLLLEQENLLPYAGLGLLLAHRQALLRWTRQQVVTTRGRGDDALVSPTLPLQVFQYIVSLSASSSSSPEQQAQQLDHADLLMSALQPSLLDEMGSVRLLPFPSNECGAAARILFLNAVILRDCFPESVRRSLVALYSECPARFGYVAGQEGIHSLSSSSPTSASGGEVDEESYLNPYRTERGAAFYANYFAMLPVLPVEDLDMLHAFGRTERQQQEEEQQKGGSPETQRGGFFPMRVLDCRSLKSFEYARLPHSIYIGDLIGGDPGRASLLMTRTRNFLGEHLVIFGTGRNSSVSANSGNTQGGAASSLVHTAEDETHMMMALALQLVVAARYPFVSICVEGLEGLRRLIYHRKLPLCRGPVAAATTTTTTTTTSNTNTTSPSNFSSVTETGAAVLQSMRQLFTITRVTDSTTTSNTPLPPSRQSPAPPKSAPASFWPPFLDFSNKLNSTTASSSRNTTATTGDAPANTGSPPRAVQAENKHELDTATNNNSNSISNGNASSGWGFSEMIGKLKEAAPPLTLPTGLAKTDSAGGAPSGSTSQPAGQAIQEGATSLIESLVAAASSLRPSLNNTTTAPTDAEGGGEQRQSSEVIFTADSIPSRTRVEGVEEEEEEDYGLITSLSAIKRETSTTTNNNAPSSSSGGGVLGASPPAASADIDELFNEFFGDDADDGLALPPPRRPEQREGGGDAVLDVEEDDLFADF